MDAGMEQAAQSNTIAGLNVAAADQCRRGDDLALSASMSAADFRVFFTSIEPAGRPSLGGLAARECRRRRPRPSATIIQTH